jgi:glucose-1-phosphate thymidylyltransferase
LKLAEDFADGDKICVVLGDNIIEKQHPQGGRRFFTQQKGAKILLKEVPDPERFGVAGFEGEGDRKVAEIIEKPRTRRATLAVTGIYFYDARCSTSARRSSRRAG